MAEPVTVSELKAAADIVRTDQDTMLGNLITGAREHVENYTGLILVEREVTDSFNAFCHQLELSGWPVASGAEVTIAYLDSDGESQEVGSYRLRAGQRPARLWPATGAVWPYSERVSGSVTASYSAGYATPADVPQALKQAIILHCRDVYDNGTLTEAGAWAVESLMRPYRLMVIG